MATWLGRTRGGILGYKIFVFLLKKTGLHVAYVVLHIVAFYFLLFSNKRYIYFYFHSIHHFPFWKTILAIYRNYYVFGQTLLDKTALLAGLDTTLSFDFDGEEHLRKMKSGGIIISAHTGNWEIAGQLLKRLDTPINLLMFDAEEQQIKQYLENVHVLKNINIIVIRDDLSHIYDIKNALNKHELIAMHGDRFVENSKTLTCRFMGKDAPFPYGPFYLAVKFNVPVSFTYAMKESANHYHFYATPLYTLSKSGTKLQSEETIISLLNEYVKATEKIVKKYPLQWFNYYDFWKIDK